MQDSGGKQVSVTVRVRPKLESAMNEMHRTERYEALACTATSDTSLRLWDGKHTKESRSVTFSFDNVFGVGTTQADVYEAAAVDAVDAVLGGTNATILTYGQTGSGKTYTVLGSIQNNPLSNDIVTEDTGVLMRAIEDLLHFAAQMRTKAKRHVVLGISVVEIYLDEIRDLLNPQSTQGTAVAAAMVKDVVRLPGLTCASLETLVDALEVYRRAARRRVQRATAANDTSSRSHAVFSIEVFQVPCATSADGHDTAPSLAECLRARDAYIAASLDPQQRAVKPVRCAVFEGAANPLVGTNERPIMYSKLTVADLAGSEKAKHADVRGEGFEELRKINSSLSALGNVVHSLFEGSKYVPYRDSKLTMVLRDAFAAPGARISLMVNVSPTALTFDETLSSLHFADKVKAMKVSSVPSLHDAKGEEAYLTSLRAHDAILADVRIFACENELQGRQALFLPQAAAIRQGADNPLFCEPMHTAVPDGPRKAAAMAALCTHVQAVRGSGDGAARAERFFKAQHKQAKQEMLTEYLAARKAVKAELRETVEAVEALRQEEMEREKGMLAVLEATHAAYSQAHARRQQLDKAKQEVVAKSQALRQLEAQTAAHMQRLEREFATDPSVCRSGSQLSRERESQQMQDLSWSLMERSGPQAVALAELRQQWVELHVANARLRGQHGRSVGSAASCADAELWLRNAVLAMAGNAVVQSQRRRQQQQQQQRRRGSEGSTQRHEDPGLFGTVDMNRPLRYWTQKRVVEEEQKRRPLRHSPYDDPRLGETIAAFMDMGGPVRRLSRDGTLHQRIFYVVERHGRKRLCWDEEGHRKQQALRLGSMGHVELSSVRRIVLGQGTPTFRRCKTHEDFFASFSLEYQSSSASPLRFLDLVCGSVRDMETWVIGLSQATGLPPVYVDTSQPDGTGADAVDGAAPVKAALPPAALRLTQEWYIPVATVVEATAQVNARRMTRANQLMTITPGELADVTKLDIFRGCALWLHLRQEGLVENPGERLYCYIAFKEERSSTGTNATAATPALTDSPPGSQREPSPATATA